jgi:endo-1,4-beta-D-glucanase Y
MSKKEFPWPTVRRQGLVAATGLSEEYVRTDLQKTLQEGIHWFRLPNSIRILWNLNLVRDWLVNGYSPAHTKAIEKYIASLPSSDAA